jgi:transposase
MMAAEAMGVGKPTVDKWARQVRQERNGDDVETLPISEERRRISDLEREVQRLKMEKKILKKATALLMSDSTNDLR